MTGVARSGYYAWCGNRESLRARENRDLTERIRRLFTDSKQTYGCPRIVRALRKQGCRCGKNRVAGLMQLAGIRAVHARKFRVTTVAKAEHEKAPNLLQQQFHAPVPNHSWTSDITYIPTREGWLYLAIMLDLFSRRVVGWSMQDRLVDDLVVQAFDAAWMQRRPNEGLVVHSDRGLQYSGSRFRAVLAGHACVQSMSATGNCYDNAVTESFFHTLKVEMVNRHRFQFRDEARKNIFEYIESFYNRQRMHSTLGYVSPAEFEEQSTTEESQCRPRAFQKSP